MAKKQISTQRETKNSTSVSCNHIQIGGLPYKNETYPHVMHCCHLKITII